MDTAKSEVLDAMKTQRPQVWPERRILHIVENFHNQATERWLVRTLARAREDHPEQRWSFFCILPRLGKLDGRVRQLGAEVIHSKYDLDDKWRFFWGLRKVLRAGRYEVLHLHHDVLSAFYLVAAIGLPLRLRIVQVHNLALELPIANGWKRWFLGHLMREICWRMADRIVGVSQQTLTHFLQSHAPRPGRDAVLYLGIDTTPFHTTTPSREETRKFLGIPNDAQVLLFVGRMTSFKNPCFVLDMLASLASNQPPVYAVFAGSGELEQVVLDLAAQKGVGERVRVLGWCDDCASLMRASDLFVNPCLEGFQNGYVPEALGLVNVEAQAAALPLLVSWGCPDDAFVIPELVTRLPLSAGPVVWATTATKVVERPRSSPGHCVQKVEQSQFGMKRATDNLLHLYNSA